MRPDARRRKRLAAAIALLLAAPCALRAGQGAFDQRLELLGTAFHVHCPNASSINPLRIETDGLEAANPPITREVDGSVTAAEVGDLDANGDPEIYVFVNSAGSGSYGSLVAYAVNAGKSLSEIYLPPLTDDAALARGYMGHDVFRVVEGKLVRRFPLYREDDTNANPTGGEREIHYRLVPGEAGWILEPERVVER